MTYLPRIALLLITASLSAQEIDEQSGAGGGPVGPELDPIAAEVFGDDMIAPLPDAATDLPPLPEQEIVQDEEPEPDLPPVPGDEQTVPVADEATLDGSATTELDATELAATDEDRLIAEYAHYVQLMRDRVYDEADSVAKRVVELTLQVKGPKSTEFSKALINLAIVQHFNKQFDAAQQNFQSAIEIIESNEDRLNSQLINPLKGLGASQLDGGRPDLANETFSRAVHVTHVNEGPHNLDQIEILESLAETNLRLGAVDDARQMQEIIYSLNAHAYSDDSVEFVPSLLRRADWQHRAGFINDERATLRRAVRILEVQIGDDDLNLVEPLIRLGRTYFYIDTSGSQTGMQNAMTSGEIYFKRAMRIATESPDADWQVVAHSSLALGDYYMFENSWQRALTVYKETWAFLTESEERLDFRRDYLEQAVLLRERKLPQFITPPGDEATAGQPEPLLSGNVTLEYDIATNGRAANLKIVDMQPAAFSGMQRTVQREMRGRLYRPRMLDAEPIVTPDQQFVHRFFYTQSDLDARRDTVEGLVDEDEDEDEAASEAKVEEQT